MGTERAVTPTLRMIKGATPGRLFELDRDATMIGRLRGCDVRLEGDIVSRRHAQIVRDRDGYFIEDLRSKSGTYVDGRRVNGPVRLLDGSAIRICDTLFVFSAPVVTILEADEGDSTILDIRDVAAATDRPLDDVRPEEKLRAILEISRALVGTIDLEDVLEQILDSLFRIFPLAERGFVLMRGHGTADPVTRAIKSRHGDPGRMSISRTIFNHVMREGKAIRCEDVMAKFGASRSVADARIRTMLCVPLWNGKRRPVGLVQLDTSSSQGRFRPEDLDLMVAVAVQVSLAVENARLLQVEIRQEMWEQECQYAREVQLELLPRLKPQLEGYEFWDYYAPAEFVGGDYFDYHPVVSPGASPRRWAIALGDVTGKSMSAALLMARLSSQVRLILQIEPDPARVVERLNRELCETELRARFITFLLVLIDGARHELTVVNAGHMGPMIRRADGAIEVIGQARNGPPLAIQADQAYEALGVPIGVGDLVVLCTDGVIDAMDCEGRLFTIERLKHALAAAPAGACAAGEAILQAIRLHAHGCPPNDDLTLLCFGRTGADGSRVAR